MASPSYTYTLTNGNTADASQVTQNFNDILNGVTDGSKDLNISALTCAGTATLNGHVNLGNAAGDDLTITASLASTLAIKTNNTYNIGAATLGLAKIYLGNGGAGATCNLISASHATTRQYTLMDCGAAANFVMSELDQTINGIKTFATSIKLASSGATASAFNFYAEDDTTLAAVTFQGNLGGSASAGIAIKITRIGRIVTLGIPGKQNVVPTTSSTNLMSNTALPSWAIPGLLKSFITVSNNNGTTPISTTMGELDVDTNGILRFYRDWVGTAYTNSASAGWEQINVTYTV